MKTLCNRFHFLTVLFVTAVLPLLLSCAGPDGASGYGESHQDSRKGYLSLFLHLKEEQSPPLRMELQSVDVLDEDGSWFSLDAAATTIDAGNIGGGQIFLARGLLQPGNYTRIRLHLRASYLMQADGPFDLHMPQEETEYAIPSQLYLNSGDSHSLFLTWDVRASLGSDRSFTPVFHIAPRLKNLIVDAAYVSCPDINTVFMIRTDLNRVYDSLGVTNGPIYLFSSSVSADENLFVLTESEPAIKRIGMSVNRVVETYSLPMTGSATHMAIDPEGRRAFIVDRQRGTVMRMNLSTGHVEERERLGYGPSYILYLEHRNLLAVSLALSQNVVLLDPETLSTVGAIATGNKPEGIMAFDYDKLLYIAESGGNSVLVYDLERNREWKRIPVDFSPRRIMSSGSFIYVSNYNSRSISILRSGQLGVARSISLSGAPLELANVPANRWIYVGNEGENSISIVDPVTSRVSGQIQLGARPAGIAVIKR